MLSFAIFKKPTTKRREVPKDAIAALKKSDEECSKEDVTTLRTDATSPIMLNTLSGPRLLQKLSGLSKLDGDSLSKARKTMTWLVALLMMAGVTGTTVLMYRMPRTPVQESDDAYDLSEH